MELICRISRRARPRRRCRARPPRRAARQGRPLDRHGRRVSRSCRASWAAITRCMTARTRASPTRSPTITSRKGRTTPARRRPSASSSRSPTSSTRSSAFFAIDEKPTGSRDPFALRRAALGIIRIILENRLRLPLKAAFAEAHLALRAQQRADEIGIPGSGVGVDPETPLDLLPFIADRLKVHLREEGVRHDLIAAVFALTEEDDLVRLLARVDALANFLGTEDGANLLIAYRRAANIVAIEAAQGRAGLRRRGRRRSAAPGRGARPRLAARRDGKPGRRHARTRGFRAGDGGSGDPCAGRLMNFSTR